MRLLFEVRAPLTVPAEAARELLDSDRLLELWAPDRSVVTVDREPGMVAIQGGWWYRGEMRIDDAGPALHHRVLDVSGAPRLRVWLANRGFRGYLARLQGRTDALAAAIDAELG